MNLRREQIEYLIQLGKSQGFIKFRDLREALPYDNIEEKDLKAFVQLLESEGIEVQMTNAKVIDIATKIEKNERI